MNETLQSDEPTNHDDDDIDLAIKLETNLVEEDESELEVCAENVQRHRVRKWHFLLD